MITYVPWCDGIYLSTIVQEGHTTFPIYPHFSYVFNPIPLLKGVWIQEGSLQSSFYTLGASISVFFMVLVIFGGTWAPFIDAIPSFPFHCFFSLEVFTSSQLWMKCSRLLQWYHCFSSAWVSFTALDKQTMNSSVTPSILLG